MIITIIILITLLMIIGMPHSTQVTDLGGSDVFVKLGKGGPKERGS